ncbi:MAG: DUF4097 family beta strand repeat protein [Phycisphaerae bacterium]|nr:DUF4097 family beta strand repeat protein [Phycisphaerae bacterium]
MNRRTALAALALASAGLLTGCTWNGAAYRGTRALTTQAAAGSPLRVEAVNGSIAITASTSPEVSISADVRAQTQERLDAVQILADREPDGTLVIRADWPDGGRRSSEGVSFKISLPSPSTTAAKTSNGSLSFEGLSGPITGTTSNGSVTLRNHRGDASLKTSNGSVTVSGLVGALTVATSNGAVKADLATGAQGPLDVSTSNGSVTITLPPSFTGELALSTSNGSIRHPTTCTAIELTKNSAKLRFGMDSTPASKVRTSNGSITIN